MCILRLIHDNFNRFEDMWSTVWPIAESSQLTQNAMLDSSEEVITYSLEGLTIKTVKV